MWICFCYINLGNVNDYVLDLSCWALCEFYLGHDWILENVFISNAKIDNWLPYWLNNSIDNIKHILNQILRLLPRSIQYLMGKSIWQNKVEEGFLRQFRLWIIMSILFAALLCIWIILRMYWLFELKVKVRITHIVSAAEISSTDNIISKEVGYRDIY